MVCSKGQMEDEITKAMILWEKEFKGRGPTGARTDIIRNRIMVTLQGVLSPAEQFLSQEESGMGFVKEMRRRLVEQGRPQLERMINEITQAKLLSLHTDISTKTGERVFVFVMDRDIK